MPTACPTCSKVNPSTAAYCFYDGRALTQTGQPGPWWLATKTFLAPFSFPDGQKCENFNQLALACDHRWNEARNFLGNGIWSAFFAKIGRHDLAAAAAQAAKETDRDVGLAYLLGKLPTDALREPTLALPSESEDLGTLAAGKDHKFEVVISNKGSLVLSGTAVADCDWLFFGDRQGEVSRKLFQTRDNYTLVVRVIGSKLRAGRQPLAGQIVIDTNGGRKTVEVKARVPIVPFPKGENGDHVLVGAKSPREVAVKAKAHLQEASALFERGAVRAWYASNGWAYPIPGGEGKGKAAVQQFFEALGLTKPPPLEIDTPRIVCRGAPGRRLTKVVTVSTKEAKFVNAEAYSDRAWIKVQPGNFQGNLVTIPLVIEIPRNPGESLSASVVVQGNGQQRFVVPVSLTVEAGAAVEGKARRDEAGPGRPRRWVFAGVGASLVLLLAFGAVTLSKNRQRPTPPPPPPGGGGEQQPRVEKPAPPWWDGIPDQKLAALAGELRASAPAESRPIFESLSVKSDTDRFAAYDKLAAKLPELIRDAKTREPLSRFLTECCVHEPSELNIAQLRRGLAELFPKEGAASRPEKKGGELEDALYARRIVFGAMTHKAVGPDRVRSLAKVLDAVFGLSIDTSARPEELEAESGKLLAQRCYRSTLPTASESLDHALTVRADLIAKFPEQLPQAFRDEVDADLLLAGLAKSDEGSWPTLQPIFEGCLASNDINVTSKLVAIYAKAKPDLAKKLEALMAPRWKVVAGAKLTQAEKAVAVLKLLNTDPAKAKVVRDDRAGQFQKLTDKALSSGAKPGKAEIDHLMQAVRAAHASTLGSILFNPDADGDRFDGLLGRLPEDKATAAPDEPKPAEDVPKAPAPAEPKVIDVGGGAYSVSDQLTNTSPREPVRGTYRKTYSVSMRVGRIYTLDMSSTEFRSYLRLETSAGRQVSLADSRAAGLNARITYSPQANGVYRVIATTAVKGAKGAYALRIQQGGGFGFGMPPPGVPPRFRPGMPLFPFAAEQPKPAEPKAADKESQVSKSDLASLAGAQRDARVIAFNNLAARLPDDLEASPAEKIATYLLLTIGSDGELDDVSGKLELAAKCRNLLPAIADLVGGNDKVTQQRTEAVVGRILARRLRFARDEDWRSASRKLLLRRALDLSAASANVVAADAAADSLRDLYKEQGVAFGLDAKEFLEQTRATRVLEALVAHVAAKVTEKDPTPADKEFLAQIDRHLRAAEFVADNSLEHAVLLQRIWLRVLTAHLRERVPARAEELLKLRQDLAAYDLDSRNVFDQLRVGEEKILRAWKLAHDPKKS